MKGITQEQMDSLDSRVTTIVGEMVKDYDDTIDSTPSVGDQQNVDHEVEEMLVTLYSVVQRLEYIKTTATDPSLWHGDTAGDVAGEWAAIQELLGFTEEVTA